MTFKIGKLSEIPSHFTIIASTPSDVWRMVAPDLTTDGFFELIGDLRRHARSLAEALRVMIYETTCISQEESDGSHECTISREVFTQARAAFWEFAKLVKEWEAP